MYGCMYEWAAEYIQAFAFTTVQTYNTHIYMLARAGLLVHAYMDVSTFTHACVCPRVTMNIFVYKARRRIQEGTNCRIENFVRGTDTSVFGFSSARPPRLLNYHIIKNLFASNFTPVILLHHQQFSSS